MLKVKFLGLYLVTINILTIESYNNSTNNNDSVISFKCNHCEDSETCLFIVLEQANYVDILYNSSEIPTIVYSNNHSNDSSQYTNLFIRYDLNETIKSLKNQILVQGNVSLLSINGYINKIKDNIGYNSSLIEFEFCNENELFIEIGNLTLANDYIYKFQGNIKVIIVQNNQTICSSSKFQNINLIFKNYEKCENMGILQNDICNQFECNQTNIIRMHKEFCVQVLFSSFKIIGNCNDTTELIAHLSGNNFANDSHFHVLDLTNQTNFTESFIYNANYSEIQFMDDYLNKSNTTNQTLEQEKNQGVTSFMQSTHLIATNDKQNDSKIIETVKGFLLKIFDVVLNKVIQKFRKYVSTRKEINENVNVSLDSEIWELVSEKKEINDSNDTYIIFNGISLYNNISILQDELEISEFKFNRTLNEQKSDNFNNTTFQSEPKLIVNNSNDTNTLVKAESEYFIQDFLNLTTKNQTTKLDLSNSDYNTTYGSLLSIQNFNKLNENASWEATINNEYTTTNTSKASYRSLIEIQSTEETKIFMNETPLNALPINKTVITKSPTIEILTNLTTTIATTTSTIITSTIKTTTTTTSTIATATIESSTIATTTIESSTIATTTIESSTIESSTIATTTIATSTITASTIKPYTTVTSTIKPSTTITSTIKTSTTKSSRIKIKNQTSKSQTLKNTTSNDTIIIKQKPNTLPTNKTSKATSTVLTTTTKINEKGSTNTEIVKEYSKATYAIIGTCGFLVCLAFCPIIFNKNNKSKQNKRRQNFVSSVNYNTRSEENYSEEITDDYSLENSDDNHKYSVLSSRISRKY